MAPQSPTVEFRHVWAPGETECVAVTPVKEEDEESECSASCGSEMTSISRRVLRDQASQPSVKHSSYTQMYLGTSASLRATSAQRLKAALFTKVITERKENQMQQETKKRRNHNVRIWLADGANFPDLAGFLTVDEEDELTASTEFAPVESSNSVITACSRVDPAEPDSTPISCPVVFEQAASADHPACSIKLEIPARTESSHAGGQDEQDSVRETKRPEDRGVMWENVAVPENEVLETNESSPAPMLSANWGEDGSSRGRRGCLFPSLFKCVPSLRSPSKAKAAARGSECSSDGLSAARTAEDHDEAGPAVKSKDVTRHVTAAGCKSPSLRSNLLSAASTPGQRRAPASWARGSGDEVTEVEVSGPEGATVSASIVHGPATATDAGRLLLSPAPFLIHCSDVATPSSAPRSRATTPGLASCRSATPGFQVARSVTPGPGPARTGTPLAQTGAEAAVESVVRRLQYA